MKKLLSMALAATMALSMVACGSSSKKDDSSADADSTTPVTLRFYNYALTEQEKADWWKDAIDKFEKENDNITVESITVDYNSMIQTFTNDLASGLSVDMVYGEITWIPALVDGGFIEEPSKILSKDFYDGYNKKVMEQFKYNDKVYGVPEYFTPWMIYVNKDLIEKAGLKMEDFPTTLDGLKEWIDTLGAFYKNDSNVSSIFGMTSAEVPATGSAINSMYTAFGGQLIDEKGKLADLNSKQNKTALTEMLDFNKYLVSNNYTQANLKLKDYRAAFGAGNVCMYVDESWGYAQIASVDKNASNFTVSAPLPTTMGTYGKGETIVESNCFLLSSNLTKNQKTAVDKFVQFITSTDTMEGYLNDIGLAFAPHDNMKDCKISPILEGASKGIDNVVHQTQIGSIISVQKEMASMVLNYVQNGMSADDAIKNYIKQAEYYINQ